MKDFKVMYKHFTTQIIRANDEFDAFKKSLYPWDIKEIKEEDNDAGKNKTSET